MQPREGRVKTLILGRGNTTSLLTINLLKCSAGYRYFFSIRYDTIRCYVDTIRIVDTQVRVKVQSSEKSLESQTIETGQVFI